MLEDEPDKIEHLLQEDSKEAYFHFIMDIDDYIQYDDPDLYPSEITEY